MRQLPLRTAIFTVIALAMLGSMCHAANDSSVLGGRPEQPAACMAGKATRGLTNMLTGWLEIPRQVVRTGCQDGPLWALPKGLVKGIGMTVVRTVVGAHELVFPVKIEPVGYGPLMTPAYVWGDLCGNCDRPCAGLE